MFRKARLPALVFGTALALLGPGTALAKNHDRHEHHHRRSSIYFEFGSGYYRPHPHYYYYDRWGYPRGYYDRWGYWHWR
jgi:hypothetical protein